MYFYIYIINVFYLNYVNVSFLYIKNKSILMLNLFLSIFYEFKMILVKTGL